LLNRDYRVIDATTKLRAMIAGLKTRLPITTAPVNPLPSPATKQQAHSSNAAEEAAKIVAAVTGATSVPASSAAAAADEPQQAPGAENNEVETEVTFSVEREPSTDNVQETAAGEGNAADDAPAMDTTEQHPSQEQEGDDSAAENMMSEEEARLWRRRFVSAARYVC
jgi:predicted membrane-bound mannosyltransferase